MDIADSIRLSEISNGYKEGTPVLLFDMKDIPNNTKGVVDFIDDTGRIFVETAKGISNAVLMPGEEGIRFIKDTVNYPGVISDKIALIEDVEIADVIGDFEPWDSLRDYISNGVEAFAWLKDAFIASVPEYKHCLLEENDHFVNGYVTWHFDTNSVKLHTFLNDDKMYRSPQEFVLHGADKEFVINEFNKHYVQEFGFPARTCFECYEHMDKVKDFLKSHGLSEKEALENSMFIEKINVVCDIKDIDMTTKALRILSNSSNQKTGLDAVLSDATARSEQTGLVGSDRDKEALDYGR